MLPNNQNYKFTVSVKGTAHKQSHIDTKPSSQTTAKKSTLQTKSKNYFNEKRFGKNEIILQNEKLLIVDVNHRQTCSLTTVGRPASRVMMTAPMIGRRVSDITVSTFYTNLHSRKVNKAGKKLCYEQTRNKLDSLSASNSENIHQIAEIFTNFH